VLQAIKQTDNAHICLVEVMLFEILIQKAIQSGPQLITSTATRTFASR